MIQYYIRISIITIIAFCISGCFDSNKKEPFPNIIIILADDQGYGDLGCYGASEFETPNLDKLANEGVMFTDFYASQAVCSSSRASLLTGCYSERVGITGALMPNSKIGLHPKEVTIAELLKKKNYVTGIIGKWHLGDDTLFSPLNNGFDMFFGLPYSNDMWPVNYDGTPVEKGKKKNYPDLYITDGKRKLQLVSNLDDQASLTTLYTEKAIEFIDENKDQPFFLYLPHSMPHVPLGVSSKFKGKSKQGMYGDVIMEIDWSLGQIIETLKNNGIYDNTIIIYTSDNGPWLNYGNHAGSALPLREGKGTMWEGGPRVPCIISWPDIIKGGMVIHDLTSAIDILPTIADITCADLPDHKIDGISFKGLLTGTDTIGKRNVFYYYYLNQLIGVRKDNWKLVFPHRYRSYKGVEPGNNGFPGPYAEGKSGLELYNLKYDISEEYDSSLIYPEIVEDLEIIADSARADLGDNLRKVKGKGHRQPGRLGPAGKKNVSHIAIGSKIKLSAEPYYMYEGSGISTLIDGALGSYDHNDGQWLGFWGEDVVIDIELNSVCFVDTLSIGFLQDQGPWIFLPSEVIFSHAVDTGNFIETTRFTTQIEKDSLTIVKRYSMILSDSVRFLRIVARNGGNCPDWHPGKGSDSWLFIDEVIAK